MGVPPTKEDAPVDEHGDLVPVALPEVLLSHLFAQLHHRLSVHFVHLFLSYFSKRMKRTMVMVMPDIIPSAKPPNQIRSLRSMRSLSVDYVGRSISPDRSRTCPNRVGRPAATTRGLTSGDLRDRLLDHRSLLGRRGDGLLHNRGRRGDSLGGDGLRHLEEGPEDELLVLVEVHDVGDLRRGRLLARVHRGPLDGQVVLPAGQLHLAHRLLGAGDVEPDVGVRAGHLVLARLLDHREVELVADGDELRGIDLRHVLLLGYGHPWGWRWGIGANPLNLSAT